MWTFYALSTIKMERFFKWGEIWFGRERSYFKRNFFIYVNFSGCKTNKCAECWHVANWKKRRTHYSGETTLERRASGGDYRFYAILSWNSYSGNTKLLLENYRPECKGKSLCKVRKRMVEWTCIPTHSRNQLSVSCRSRLLMPGVKPQFLSCLVTIQPCKA